MTSSVQKLPTPPRLLEVLTQLAREELVPGDLLGLRPEVLERRGRRAALMIDSGQFEAGEARLLVLSRKEARSPSFPLLLALSRARRGAHEEAITALDEAIRRSRGVVGSKLEAEARLARAESLLTLGRVALARDDLSEVAMMGPQREAARARMRLTQLNERRRERVCRLVRSNASEPFSSK